MVAKALFPPFACNNDPEAKRIGSSSRWSLHDSIWAQVELKQHAEPLFHHSL
jgi:hypothetical protein